MLGRKDKQFQQHQAVCLEDIVPQKNLYRQLEATLDLTFIHALVAEQYSSRGRPSIDPVVFFKLHLIMFFEDIRSERHLMEMVNLNLAQYIHQRHQGQNHFTIIHHMPYRVRGKERKAVSMHFR